MSAVTNTTGQWVAALVATALLLALMVGGDQPPARAIGPGETDIAYVADGYNFPDALMGATLAALNAAPMLGVRSPTTGDVVPPETAAELDRLTNDKTNKLATIYVFGGPAAVSAKVVEELGAWADDVERIFGDNRFATMEAISQMLPTKAKDADLLDGMDSTSFAAAPTTVSRTARCVGHDFQPTNQTVSFHREVDLSLTSHEDEAFFRCVIVLPDGAKITAFRFDAKDNASTSGLENISLDATNMTPSGGFGAQLASLADTGVAATHGDHYPRETTSILDHAAATVSGTYAYVIEFSVEVPSGTSRVGVNSAEVDYTTTAVPGVGGS